MTDENSEQRGGRIRIAGWSAAAALLGLPLAVMQVSEAVTWTAFDFAVAGTMLLVAGLALELAVRLRRDLAYRAGALVAVVAAVLLLWLTGAVGIIGSENNPANRLILGVVAVAAGGALLARGRPHGMAWAVLAAAGLQAAAGALALAFRLGVEGVRWPYDVLFLSAAFSCLWLIAGALFHRSARR